MRARKILNVVFGLLVASFARSRKVTVCSLRVAFSKTRIPRSSSTVAQENLSALRELLMRNWRGELCGSEGPGTGKDVAVPCVQARRPEGATAVTDATLCDTCPTGLR